VAGILGEYTELFLEESEDQIEELSQKFIKTGYSKIIVYRDNIDNIIGYVHCNDLFKKPENIGQILIPVAGFVPETSTIDKIMEQLMSQKKGVAIVVDEFGGTSGIVTLEDVVEVIFGEIEDEHDTEEHHEEQISKTEFLFAGRLEISYLNETYNLELTESDEYETLAGLFLHLWEDIPEVGVEISTENFSLTVEKVSGNKIELLRVKIL